MQLGATVFSSSCDVTARAVESELVKMYPLRLQFKSLTRYSKFRALIATITVRLGVLKNRL
jgi:hypothetical protein